MAKLFEISVSELKKVFDMPGTWTDQDYRGLLSQLEVEGFEDASGDDLFDILLMALQDLTAKEAADAVLAYKLETSTTPGVRQNIVQDLLGDQRAWEEVSDIQLHARIFASAVLLQKAFPKVFPKPDILCLTLLLKGSTPEAKALLGTPPEAAFVARVLADAMDETSILERLFSKQLASHSFPEAQGIIWQADFSEQSMGGNASAVLKVYSSAHWLNAMEQVSEFQSNAYNDSPDGEDEDD